MNSTQTMNTILLVGELAELPAAKRDNAPQFVDSFELTNGNHIAYLIYDHLEIEDKTKVIDKNKSRSTAVDVMEIYFEDEPNLEPLATVSMYTKLLSTYLRPMLGIGTADDNLPGYLTAGEPYEIKRTDD